MNQKLKLILDNSKTTEKEFLNNIPAIFKYKDRQIIAYYKDNKIYIQATTYQSLTQQRRTLHNLPQDEPLLNIIDPIEITDFDTIQTTIDSIYNNKIVTDILFKEEQSKEALEYHHNLHQLFIQSPPEHK